MQRLLNVNLLVIIGILAFSPISNSNEAGNALAVVQTDVTVDPSLPDPGRPLVGVRHFPGYPSHGGTDRNAQSQLLGSGLLLKSPISWDDRLPFYTVRTGPNTVVINEDDQDIINEEMRLCAKAGIDYWAIEADWIENDQSGFNYALNYYLSSPESLKEKLKFALIVDAKTLADKDRKILGTEENAYTKYRLKITDALANKFYQKVNGGRPLLYMWNFKGLVDALEAQNVVNPVNVAKYRVKHLLSLISPSDQAPYLVMMDLAAGGHDKIADEFGAEARTSYLGDLTGLSPEGGDLYSTLADLNKGQWNSYAPSGINYKENLNYIPLVTVGIDPRPKSFDTDLFDFGKSPKWVQQATPQQIADNVEAARNWVRQNRSVTRQTNSVLIATWMDITESGWLVPTLTEGYARLNAISVKLTGKKQWAEGEELPPLRSITHIPQGRVTVEGITPILGTEILQVTLWRYSPESVTDYGISNISYPDSYWLLTGSAPMAVRLTVTIKGMGRTWKKTFLNGKGVRNNNLVVDKRSFSLRIEMENASSDPMKLVPGTYTMSITGVDNEVKPITGIKLILQ